MARARVGGTTIWLTAAELADRVGIAHSTVWQWHLRNYGPPAAKMGGRLRFRLEAVEKWEAEQETAARRATG